MFIIELDIIKLLEQNYLIVEDCTILIKIQSNSPYWNKLSYDYPKSNIKKIIDNFNRELQFIVKIVDDIYYIYLNVKYSYSREIVNKIYIFLDKINLLYNFYNPSDLYYKKIEGNNLYSEIKEIEGNTNFIYYFDNPILNRDSTYIISQDNFNNLVLNKDIPDISKLSFPIEILYNEKIQINPMILYKTEAKYLLTNDYNFPIILGGIRYNINGKQLGGFNNILNFKNDNWEYFLDKNDFDFNGIYGTIRYGILDTNYGWGKGLNLTAEYMFGIFQNFDDFLMKQKIILDSQKFYTFNQDTHHGLHLYKNDYSNSFQKINYVLNNDITQKNLQVKIKFTNVDSQISNFKIVLTSLFQLYNIEFNFSKSSVENEYLVNVQSQNIITPIFNSVLINKSDFTFVFKTTDNNLLLYINNNLFTQIPISNFYIYSIQLQVGEQNSFSNKSHISIDYISIIKQFNEKLDFDYTINEIPSIELNNNANAYISYHNTKKIISSYIPIKLVQKQNIYPYIYNFEEQGEEFLLDLQYKNYFRKYTLMVSILDKLFQKEKDIVNIENYIWRQNTPFYIREETYMNENFVYTIFVHSLQNIIQKLKYISEEFGNVFDPYNSELYIKRAFYYYINDIGILQEYLSGIEFNSQIYMLLSINFYKHIMYYTEYSGLYSCIDKILNDQFANISSIVQLYVFVFRQLKNVEIYEFTSNKKRIKFKEFLANDGFYNIFYKQKNNQYAQYIQYITDYVKRIYKNSKYTNGIISENTIDIHINNSIDSLLQSSLYRSLIIVYDDFLVRSYNIEESIFTFFKFIKNQYLPQNMDIIFIKQSEFSLILNDVENKQHNIKDVITFNFNTLTELYSSIQTLINSENFVNGRI